MLIQICIGQMAFTQDYIDSDSILFEEYPITNEWSTSEEEESMTPIERSEFPVTNETPVWNDEKWEQIKKKYNYEENQPEEEPTEEDDEEELLDELNTERTSSLLDSIDDFFKSPIGKIIAIILAASLLIFLIIKLFSGKSLSADKKFVLHENLINDNPEELPEEDTLDNLLRQAVERGDYKMSVRILYLIIIRQLNESKCIQWQKDKTNRDYLNEMRINNGYRGFRELTLIYEIVWYGDKIIGQTDYHTVSKLFMDYQQNLIGSNKEK